MAGIAAVLSEVKVRADGATVYTVDVTNHDATQLRQYSVFTDFAGDGASSSSHLLAGGASTEVKFVITAAREPARCKVQGQAGGDLIDISAGLVILA